MWHGGNVFVVDAKFYTGYNLPSSSSISKQIVYGQFVEQKLCNDVTQGDVAVGDGPRKIPAKTFAEKVLKYLWDDAFKFKRSQVFADGLSSLEQVVSAFEKADGEKLKAVFKEF